jgi:hypothetical protein
LIRVKHPRNVVGNLDVIRRVMDLANQQFEATAGQFRHLARRVINRADLRKYVRQVLGVAGDQKPLTRPANQIEAIIGLCESGRGNDLSAVRGTWWAAYNGVTEWLGTQRGNNAESRLNSLWFGDSAALNRDALALRCKWPGSSLRAAGPLAPRGGRRGFSLRRREAGQGAASTRRRPHTSTRERP